MINGNRCKEARSPNKSRTRGKLKESGQNEGKEITHCCGNRAGSSSSSNPFGDKKTESEQTPVVPFETFRDCTSNRTGKKQNNQSSPLSLYRLFLQLTPGAAIPPSVDCSSWGAHSPAKPPQPTPSWGMRSLMPGQRRHTAMWATRRCTAGVSPWWIPHPGRSQSTLTMTQRKTITTTLAQSRTIRHAPCRAWTVRGPAWGPFCAPPDLM